MSRERETWDKINRQKKVSVRRETPSGPSPVGDFLKRLSNKHKLAHQEQEAKRLREIEILAEMEWRQFTLPSFVKEQLREFEIDEGPLVKAVQATLTSRPIAARSSPVKFWMYCRRIKKAERLARSVHRKKLHPKILKWLMKFAREARR